MKKEKNIKKKEKKEKKKKDRINWKRTWRNNTYMLGLVFRISPLSVIIPLILAIIGGAESFLSGTYLYKYALNALQEGKEMRSIVLTIGIILIFSLTYTLLRGILGHFCSLRAQRINSYIDNMIYEKATEVELACFENSEFYDKYVCAASYATESAWDVINNLSNFVYVLTSVAAVGTLIVSVDPVFILIAFIPLTVTLITGKKRNRTYYNYRNETYRASRQRDYVRRTFYLADFSKEMRLTEMYRVMFRRMKDSIAELKQIAKKYGPKLMLFRELSHIVYESAVNMGTIALAAFKTVVLKTMLIGDCFVVINSIESIAANIEAFGRVAVSLDNNSLYIENFREFLEYESKIPEIEDAPQAPSMSALEIRDLTFKYEGKETPALNGISLCIKKGERIALVGHNGAGKSTFIKLLQRFYDPDEGEILLNGENVKNFRLSTFRSLFGTVFQDHGLFAASIAKNVMLKGDLDESDKDKAKEALKLSGVWEKIESLSDGIDTEVTREFDDNGAVFSGGEAQKIAIARVYAQNSEIIIMDEPTSALDPIAENQMYNNMFAATRDKTVIFISHRLSCATLADRVYLFENGRISESGSHKELLALNGKYAEMWHKQADSYNEQNEENAREEDADA